METSKTGSWPSRAPRRTVSAPDGYDHTPKTQSAPIETLYIHPSVRIVAFAAQTACLSPSVDAAREESGTLPPQGRLERTIAVGPLRIYRAPGSVAFLSCGSALQPILPKSQCWCIDEDNAKYVLQIRRPNFWRIELPTTTEDYQKKAAALGEVLAGVLQFERTYCPFQRTFTVELPEEAHMPIKKIPWTPKHLPITRFEVQKPPAVERGEDPITEEPEATTEATDASASIIFSPITYDEPATPKRPPTAASITDTSNAETPRPSNNYSVAEIVEEINGNYTSDAVAQTGALGIHLPLHSEGLTSSPTKTPRRLSLSVAPEREDPFHDDSDEPETFIIRSASVSGISHVHNKYQVRPEDVELPPDSEDEDETKLPRTPSQISMQSTESWHSVASSGSPTSLNPVRSHTSNASQNGGSQISRSYENKTLENGIYLGEKGLSFPKLRRPVSITQPENVEHHRRNTLSEMGPGNRQSFMSTTSGMDTDDEAFQDCSEELPSSQRPISSLPPGSLAQESLLGHLAPAQPPKKTGIPLMIITKTCSMLLTPPAHLIALMLRVAAKLSAGESTGRIYGYGDNGEQIPVHWHYSDDELSD